MSTHAETVPVLQAEFERLTQYLAALPAAAWTTPSACTDWAVRDVVAPLIRAAELYRQWITRGRQGDTSTPEGSLAPGTFQTASPAERQQMGMAAAQRAIALRKRLCSDFLDVFRTTWDHHNQLVASRSAHAWSPPAIIRSACTPCTRWGTRPSLHSPRIAGTSAPSWSRPRCGGLGVGAGVYTVVLAGLVGREHGLTTSWRATSSSAGTLSSAPQDWR
jgi:hypothetical protein